MKVEVKCDYCGSLFLSERKSVNQRAKNGWKTYCSKECQNKAAVTAIEVTCATCGKFTMKTPKEIRKSKSGKLFCSRRCSRLAIDSSCYPSGEEHPNFDNGKSSYRARAIAHYGAKCSVCGYDIEPVLEVHHKDGNRRNNKIENLDVLCPTHHTEYQLGIRKYV